MDDNLLARAKQLSQAANQIAANLSSINNNCSSSSNITTGSDDNENNLSCGSNNNSPVRAKPPAGSIVGAVFKGSSLIRTYEDIRTKFRRGSVIIIDGVNCTVSMRGEYSATEIQLAEDFTGPTNTQAIITYNLSCMPKMRKYRVKADEPIPSSDIQNAVKELDSINIISTASKHDSIAGTLLSTSSKVTKASKLPVLKKETNKYNQYIPLDNTNSNGSNYNTNSSSSSGHNVDNRCKSAPPTKGDDNQLVSQRHDKHLYKMSSNDEFIYTKNNTINPIIEREKAMKRVSLKLKEEKERRLIQEQEEIERKEVAKQSSYAKVEVLLQKTMLRNEERKRIYLGKLIEEKENKDRLLVEKTEKHKLIVSKEHEDRVIRIRMETKMRLNNIKKMEHDIRTKKEMEIVRQLNELNEVTMRNIPTKQLIKKSSSSTTASRSRVDSDDGYIVLPSLKSGSSSTSHIDDGYDDTYHLPTNTTSAAATTNTPTAAARVLNKFGYPSGTATLYHMGSTDTGNNNSSSSSNISTTTNINNKTTTTTTTNSSSSNDIEDDDGNISDDSISIPSNSRSNTATNSFSITINTATSQNHHSKTIHQQQHEINSPSNVSEITSSSPSSSSRNTYSCNHRKMKTKKIWRMLPPIPVQPYQPVV